MTQLDYQKLDFCGSSLKIGGFCLFKLFLVTLFRSWQWRSVLKLIPLNIIANWLWDQYPSGEGPSHVVRFELLLFLWWRYDWEFLRLF